MTTFIAKSTLTNDSEPVFTVIFRTDDEEMYKKVQKLCRDMVDISKLRTANESIRNQKMKAIELKNIIPNGGNHA